MSGKCPKCEKLLGSVKIEAVEGIVGFQSAWNCITLSCPFCNTILSTQIDPIALKADIIDGVVKKLRNI